MSDLELLRGTLDVLILKALAADAKHGYGVAQWIRAMSGEELLVEEGALYPALHRLAKRGWVQSEWGVSENNRRARFYALTAQGRAQLELQTRTWDRYSSAVSRVLTSEADG